MSAAATPYVVTELVMATGGTEPAVRALLSTRSDASYGEECLYCLDAPEILPAGSHHETFTRRDRDFRHVVSSVYFRGE